MNFIWYCLVALMITGYVVLDGYDLGAGIVHLFVAKGEQERRAVLRSIGPVWDGNEVWLLAGGGTLYFAFPALYASSFSGFYLPLMMVLWLLMIRGISIEFRNHVDNAAWKPFWDAGFAISSVLLAIFFGAALGNVVRGVPLDQAGEFFLPLWTNFEPGADPGILDWYTILVGLLALATLTLHGALWVRYRTVAQLNARSGQLAKACLYVVIALTALATIASFRIQPQDRSKLRQISGRIRLPRDRDCRAGRDDVHERRTAGFPLELRLHCRNADQRSIRSLSVCSAVERKRSKRSDDLE
jgi:cytochrome d ubiquinol oxidase subunit II